MRYPWRGCRDCIKLKLEDNKVEYACIISPWCIRIEDNREHARDTLRLNKKTSK